SSFSDIHNEFKVKIYLTAIRGKFWSDLRYSAGVICGVLLELFVAGLSSLTEAGDRRREAAAGAGAGTGGGDRD
ncbi:MAG TPA: hypothetical protein PLN07_06505, partial [Myxococcota bacterium]|nr:hypothetical protein [Myxococcota bacterium]